MSLSTIIETAGGWFRARMNEVFLDTKPAFRDPVKYRGGAWHPDSWLVIVGGDLLTGSESDPRRNERGFFGVRHDDDFPKADNAQEFAIYLTTPNQEGDTHQRCALRLTSRYLEVWGRRLDPGGQPRVTRFYTDGGKFCVNWQDDTGTPTGIVYRVNGTDEATWTPVGRVRIDPL